MSLTRISNAACQAHALREASLYLGGLSYGLNNDIVVDWLFCNHPRFLEKARGGSVQCYSKERYHQSYQLFAHIDNGETVDFSYTKTIKHMFGSRERLHETRVMQAFRFAVEDQVSNWRAAYWEHPQHVSPEDQVDHAYPNTFSDLVRRFMDALSIQIENIALLDRGTAGPGYKLMDVQILRAWQNFHRQNAALRWVNPHANRINGNRAPKISNLMSPTKIPV